MFRSLLDTIKTFFRSVHRSLKQSAARVCETPLCQTQTTCFDPQVTPPDLHHHHTIPREHRCNHLFGYHQHLLHTNLLSPTIPLPSHTTPRTDHHYPHSSPQTHPYRDITSQSLHLHLNPDTTYHNLHSTLHSMTWISICCNLQSPCAHLLSPYHEHNARSAARSRSRAHHNRKHIPFHFP